MRTVLLILIVACAVLAPLAERPSANVTAPDDKLLFPNEKHLRNIRQLTFGGENAEAYFSADGKKLIFQSTREGVACDQIFEMNIDGTGTRMLSTGKGRTTCSYFYPNGKRIVYSSTHLASPDCPPKPDYSRGYVWALYAGFDIFSADDDGKDVKALTTTPGYDAEATIAPNGKKIVFTSLRDGDLDIYTMDADGRNVKRLTTEVGYDGGPFFSSDSQWIIYRAYHPKTEKEVEDYRSLLKENLIRPTKLDLWIMKADGTQKRRVTDNAKANFAPYFFPDSKRVIFSSNMNDPRGRNFDLYAINTDGSGLEQVTFNETFDGFPMFSPDGKKLVFASNRNAKSQGDTNIFIADWMP